VSPVVVAGCSDSPYPRVEFPNASGAYIQLYLDGYAPTVELAKVDESGNAVTLTSKEWLGQVKVENGLNHQTARFAECGVTLAFSEREHGVIVTSEAVLDEVERQACPLGKLPAQWKLIEPS